jgi:hypothetical protein
MFHSGIDALSLRGSRATVQCTESDWSERFNFNQTTLFYNDVHRYMSLTEYPTDPVYGEDETQFE